MDATSIPPPPQRAYGTHRTVLTWIGAVLYPFMALLPAVSADERAPGILPACGSALATVLLVGLIRRRPMTALVMMLLVSALLPPAAKYHGPVWFVPFVAVDVTLGYVVGTRTLRSSAVAVCLTFLTQCLTILGFTHGPDNLVVIGTIALLALVTACVVGLLGSERRRHATELRSHEVAEAITAERLRIARELHDQVAHSIGIIAIQAGVGSRVIETQPLEARAALSAIEATSRETLSGLRRTLVALRRSGPSVEPEAAPYGPAPGLADLERLTATTTDAGVEVDLRWSGLRRQLPPDIDLSAYRIVQEALTNVVRHSGAGRCRVSVGFGEDELSVEIVDEGRGMRGAGTGEGFGITGMRERVALLHGEFGAGPRPEGGFRVAARLPLPERTATATATATTTATDDAAAAGADTR
ncbi:sensor histidine kinase [Streptomyces sp. NPDC001939]|uniref:sensor histidine kinase n=1 Tax=Streptomyces TaxID=1883 RepID=UPI001D0AC6DB|nr:MULTISPECIES: sensor histidine kinase [Streptomyces]MCX5080699.1 sensor histidine kinase [Streptomyces sp. NBC_00401]UDL98928.1 sensor histidine kinase [Streptomyces longhuiensis]